MHFIVHLSTRAFFTLLVLTWGLLLGALGIFGIGYGAVKLVEATERPTDGETPRWLFPITIASVLGLCVWVMFFG